VAISDKDFHALFSSAPVLSHVSHQLPAQDQAVVDYWRNWCLSSASSESPSAIESLIEIIDRLTRA
jgi:hypothetical protein